MKIINKKAVSVLEYVLLFIIIIGAFLVMQNYIQHGIYGNWGQTGQSLAFGRQYDPQKSVDCAFDGQSNDWYDHNCYEYYIRAYGCIQKASPVDAECEENIVINGTCGASTCNEMNNGVSMFYHGG